MPLALDFDRARPGHFNQQLSRQVVLVHLKKLFWMHVSPQAEQNETKQFTSKKLTKKNNGNPQELLLDRFGETFAFIFFWGCLHRQPVSSWWWLHPSKLTNVPGKGTILTGNPSSNHCFRGHVSFQGSNPLFRSRFGHLELGDLRSPGLLTTYSLGWSSK